MNKKLPVETFCSCDLSDHRADCTMDSFPRISSRCTVIFGRLVTLSITLPSSKHLPAFSIQNDCHISERNTRITSL